MEKTIPRLSAELGIELEISLRPLDLAENFEALVALEQSLGDRDNELPAVVIGGRILGGKAEIERDLRKLLSTAATGKDTEGISLTDDGNGEITERLKSVKLLPIFAAGLLDGINPCAFTTIIFLISYLFYLGRRRKEILTAGLAFAGGVFLTYFLLGIGLSELLRSFTPYPIIATLVKYLVAGLALALGIYSFYDYYLCLRGRTSELALQLPRFLKERIHREVRERTKSSTLIFSSLIMGFFISLFELSCTGQIYLPTIIYMTSLATQRMKGYFFLILYNLAFILPLLVVFLLVYYGFTAEKLVGFFRKNVAMVKLLTGILFLGLSALVLLV